MNKKLFVLLPVAMLTLTGCSGDKDKDSGEEGGEVKELVIDKSVISPFVPEGKTYVGEAFTFKVSEIEFAGTAGVGVKSAEIDSERANGYNELGAMQFKKNEGTVKNTTEFPAKKIVVEWVATFASEESKYWPKAAAGSTTALSAVTAAEADPQSGTETGKQQYNNDANRDVYKYVSTFNLPEGTKFFSVGDSGGATYITKITISK